MGKGSGSTSGFAGVACCGAVLGWPHGEVSLLSLPPLLALWLPGRQGSGVPGPSQAPAALLRVCFPLPTHSHV